MTIFLEFMGFKWQLYFTSPTDFFMLQAPNIEHRFMIDNNKVKGFQIIIDEGKHLNVQKVE